MKKFPLILLLFMLIFVAGCVQEQPVKNLTIDGVDYQFSNDIGEAKKIPVSNPQLIQNVLLRNRNISIVVNCSVPEERPEFAVVAHNAVSTIQNYLIYSYRTFAVFDTYCFVGEQWYNSTDDKIEKPNLTSVIWFKGARTGANGTSVYVDNNTVVVVQGTSYKNLTLATDALSLTVLGQIV